MNADRGQNHLPNDGDIGSWSSGFTRTVTQNGVTDGGLVDCDMTAVQCGTLVDAKRLYYQG